MLHCVALRLGNVVPDFSCETTQGKWDSFLEWKKVSWVWHDAFLSTSFIDSYTLAIIIGQMGNPLLASCGLHSCVYDRDWPPRPQVR
jgi:hypothetical protein